MDQAEKVAEVLEIAAPESANADEWRDWLAWWQSSYETARQLSDEQKAYLKSGGWWPPVTAVQIATVAPAIVRRTARPGVFDL